MLSASPRPARRPRARSHSGTCRVARDPQCVLRPDARTLPRDQRRLRPKYKRDRTDLISAVARWLGHAARAVIDASKPTSDPRHVADTNAIAKSGLLPLDWTSKLPNNSLPYTSTIVFVCARAIRKASKIGRTSSSRASNRDAEPQDVRHGKLSSSPPGARSRNAVARMPRPRLREKLYDQTPCSTSAPRRDDHLRPERSVDVTWPGRTRPISR